jgi:nitrous oxide reductase accessory protein NosL
MNPTHAFLLFVALALPACKESAQRAGAAAAASAAPIGIAECAACKMVVREQPAPRGQVVHRDGHRVHLCSIADLVHYVAAPSPHGAPSGVFVEALEDGFDPKSTDTKERPWVPAESAAYVVGVPRQHIMGPPVLAYSDRLRAETAAARHGGKVTLWKDLPAKVAR